MVARKTIRSAEQLAEWVNGNNVHTTRPRECVPDFSCCKPHLAVSAEVRKLYADADRATQECMLAGFLARVLTDAGCVADGLTDGQWQAVNQTVRRMRRADKAGA